MGTPFHDISLWLFLFQADSCKVVLTVESVDEILWCDHSIESYWAVLYCGTVYYAVQGGSCLLYTSDAADE